MTVDQGMVTSTGPRVLFVAQAYAPITGSHAARVEGLVRGLARQGCIVHVLTTTVPGTQKPVDEAENSGVLVHRSFVGPVHWLMGFRKSAAFKLLTDGDSLARRLAIPDTFIEWLPSGILGGLFHCLRCWKPDVVVSSAVPYTAHLIAGTVASLMRVPLVVDYGDPWVFDPGHPRRGIRLNLEYRAENWVLSHAKAVTVTTATTKELYLKKYRSLDASRIFVVPMGYDTRSFGEASRNCISESVGSSHLRLVYAGSVRTESRNLEPLLAAVGQLNGSTEGGSAVQLRILGVIDKRTYRAVAGIASGLSLVGWIRRSKVIEELIEADVLVLLGNNNSVQTPGKLFEYIGSGTPVLYIKDHNDSLDDCERHLSLSGRAYWTVRNSVESIEDWLRWAVRNQNAIKYAKQTGIPPKEDCSWQARAQSLFDILCRVVNSDTTRLTPPDR